MYILITDNRFCCAEILDPQINPNLIDSGITILNPFTDLLMMEIKYWSTAGIIVYIYVWFISFNDLEKKNGGL